VSEVRARVGVRLAQARPHVTAIGVIAVLLASLSIQPLLFGAWWVTRTVVETLYGWAADPLAVDSGRFELTFADARVFIVAFRFGDTAIEAETVMGFPARSDGDYYRLTLRLMEI
jgi:hypothetical protein